MQDYVKPVFFIQIGVRRYISNLEQAVINTCNHYEIEAHRTEHTGVWLGDNKLCAIGIYMCNACVLYVHNTIYTSVL